MQKLLDILNEIRPDIEFNNGTTLRGYCTNCLDVDDDIGFTLLYPGDQGGGARIKYYDGLRAGLEVIHRF